MSGSPPATRPWFAEFVLLAAIWGSSFLFTRLAVVEFGALPTAGVRVAIASLFLLPLSWSGQLLLAQSLSLIQISEPTRPY